jgi:hypothetical protein
MNKVPVPACTRRFQEVPICYACLALHAGRGVARRSSPALMGSVAEEGCVILARDVCEVLAIRITTGGMSFAAHLAAYGRCLEHDAANALEPGLSSLRPSCSAAGTDRKHAARSWRPYDRRGHCAVCVQRLGHLVRPYGRHGRRRPLSRIRDDRVQRDGAPWSPEGLIAARWGSKPQEIVGDVPDLCRGMHSAHRGGTRRDLRL